MAFKITPDDGIRALNFASIAVSLYERAYDIRLHGPDKSPCWSCITVVPNGIIDKDIPEIWLDIYPYGERLSTVIQLQNVGDVLCAYLTVWDAIDHMAKNPERYKPQTAVKD